MKKLLGIIIIIAVSMLLSSCSMSGKESDKKLYLGIKNANLEQVKEALDDGANIDSIGGMIFVEPNPIKIALNEGLQDITDYLIEHGANANYADRSGYSLLMFSAYNGNVHFSELLLKHGAKINQKDKHGKAAVDYALQRLSISKDQVDDLITLLLEHGAQIGPDTFQTAINAYYKDDNGCDYTTVRKILEGLIKSGYKSNLDPMLESAILAEPSRMNLQIKNNKINKQHEKDILFYTVAFGNLDTVKLLEEKGIDFNSFDKFKNTPLAIAAQYGNLEIVNYLLDKGADIEVLNNNKETPLELAVRYNHYEVADFLIKHGAEIRPDLLNLASSNIMDPEIWTTERGHFKLQYGYEKELYRGL